MGKLIYTTIQSLDGYVEDASGSFEWAMPDEEVHAHVNDGERDNAVHLYGRAMYDVLKVWQTLGDNPDDPAAIRDYAQIWRAADKIVFSRTLTEVDTSNTRIESEFTAGVLQSIKNASSSNIAIGGAGLAAQAFEFGLIDEINVYSHPVIIGDGKRSLAQSRVDLELVDEQRFASGVVFLKYNVRT